MRPLGSAAATPITQTHSHSNGETQADRELLIDIDFFDAQGRWHPTHVVFCTAEDKTRAKSLWTRCFRGLMALHGKLWAKNYLSSHFQNKPEATKLLRTIQETGVVDNGSFRETVAHCTLMYQDLEKLVAGKVRGHNRIMPASPIQDIEQLVAQHFLKINWSAEASEEFFERLTLPTAKNVTGLIRKLKIEERNDPLIDQIAGLMEKFQAWLDQSESEFKTVKKISDRFNIADEKIIDHKNQYRSTLCNLIIDEVKRYRAQREAQEPTKALLEALDKEKDRCIAKDIFFISFVGHLDESGLLDYLRHGMGGLDEDLDFKIAERIINLPSDRLRDQASFLSDEEFLLLQKRFKRLKTELPRLKADADRKSAVSEKTLFAKAVR